MFWIGSALSRGTSRGRKKRWPRSLGLKEWPREAGSRERWIVALSEHPKLIQRPIITAEDGTAVVARSEEAVRDALGRR